MKQPAACAAGCLIYSVVQIKNRSRFSRHPASRARSLQAGAGFVESGHEAREPARRGFDAALGRSRRMPDLDRATYHLMCHANGLLSL